MTGVTRACGHGEVWTLQGDVSDRSRKVRDLKRTVCVDCQKTEERFIEQLRAGWNRTAA